MRLRNRDERSWAPDTRNPFFPLRDRFFHYPSTLCAPPHDRANHRAEREKEKDGQGDDDGERGWTLYIPADQRRLYIYIPQMRENEKRVR